jgi:methyl-accepting chemotaxis protein
MQAVTNGNELTRSTQEAYQENIKILESIGQLVDSVAMSSKEQSDGIMEINLAISEIDRVTQQSSSHAVQSTEASDRMNNQVAQLKKHIFDLASLIGAK